MGQPKSIGLKTDLFFHQFSGNVISKENYLVIHTPNNPEYYWGNYLIFDGPPKKTDSKKWIDAFKNEFGHRKSIDHIAFTWDLGEVSNLDEFVEKGFHIDKSIILTLNEMSSPSLCSGNITLKEIQTNSEWKELIDLQILIGNSDGKYENYIKFTEKKFFTYKKIVSSNKGTWLGAYDSGKLIGDLGIFLTGAFGRFQNIETHPDYRGKNICRSLIYKAFHWIKNRNSKAIIVVESEANSLPLKIYKKLGFSEKEFLTSLLNPNFSLTEA